MKKQYVLKEKRKKGGKEEITKSVKYVCINK